METRSEDRLEIKVLDLALVSRRGSTRSMLSREIADRSSEGYLHDDIHMTYTLAIDPGARGCGAALFQCDGSNKLIAAEYVVCSRRDELRSAPFEVRAWVAARVDCLAVSRVVLEFPQTYRGRAARGDTNDLLSLAFVDGAIAALFALADVTLVRPFDWKGSIPKPASATGNYIIRSRVEARLSGGEKATAVWPKNGRHSWDVADAIGIGLHHLGRFAPQRGAR